MPRHRPRLLLLTRAVSRLRATISCVTTARALLPLTAATLFAACGTTSDPHRITLGDGQVFESVDQPRLDKKTGYFRFRDRQGKDILLRDDEVTVIERQ